MIATVSTKYEWKLFDDISSKLESKTLCAAAEQSEVLRDQYITGLLSDKVVEGLVCLPPETFDQDVERARQAEEADTLLKTMEMSRNRGEENSLRPRLLSNGYRMSFGRCTSKMCLGVLGALFLATAIGAFVVSGYVLVTYKHYDSFTTAQYALIPATFFTFVGVVFLITGFIGCWSMCNENKCLLFSFFLALLLILTLLITSVTLSFTYKSQINELIVNSSMDALYKYGPLDGRETIQVDFMQTQMQCCGFTNYTDWVSTPWGHQHPDEVPKSCCKSGIVCTGSMSNITTINVRGCYPKWKELLTSNIKQIAVGSLSLTLILLVGMVCTCSLLCYKRRDPNYSSLN
uniref:Tetraspanin n=1 Tax=Trichuris muris TaxID=70415 RepID=A0A5S6QEV0_TRIMR